MKIWIMSDTHFGHDNIIAFTGRPENHEQLMIDALYAIPKEDCLFHLGDVCLAQGEFVNNMLIGSLKCRKILVIGNHDEKSWSWYMEHGWDFACDAFKLDYAGKHILFSHKPQPWDGLWEINVHGHLHNLGFLGDRSKTQVSEMKKWHRLYAPELMDYKPVELAQFIQAGNNG